MILQLYGFYKDYSKCSDGSGSFSSLNGLDCYIGVDLGATSDLTVHPILVVDGEKYYFKTHYYLPEAALEEKADKELYKLWKRLGLLTVTPGNVTDYDYITTGIFEVQRSR